jgi:hypothetical protein
MDKYNLKEGRKKNFVKELFKAVTRKNTCKIDVFNEEDNKSIVEKAWKKIISSKI